MIHPVLLTPDPATAQRRGHASHVRSTPAVLLAAKPRGVHRMLLTVRFSRGEVVQIDVAKARLGYMWRNAWNAAR